jgi:hypothetical protein
VRVLLAHCDLPGESFAVRWDPECQDETFFHQSATLYEMYYMVQITIHRPVIPQLNKRSLFNRPALVICSNAARACSRILAVHQRRHNRPLIMQFVSLPQSLNQTMADGQIGKCLHVWCCITAKYFEPKTRRNCCGPHRGIARRLRMHECAETMCANVCFWLFLPPLDSN